MARVVARQRWAIVSDETGSISSTFASGCRSITVLNLIGRANYSFEDDQTLELLAGVEYESCCWAVRLIGREYIRDRESDTRTAVFLELHLKGLGSLGRRPYPLFADYAY